MTLRDGRVKAWKDLQFGLQTGDPRGFASFDDVWKAFCAQLEQVMRHIMTQQYAALEIKPRHFAAPFASMVHDLAT